MSKETVNVGVVGVGGWGKNLARNYSQIPEANLMYLCDLDESKHPTMQSQFMPERITTQFDDLIEDPKLQAVVIATTGPTHYDLCKKALLADKDVYVEKPFVL